MRVEPVEPTYVRIIPPYLLASGTEADGLAAAVEAGADTETEGLAGAEEAGAEEVVEPPQEATSKLASKVIPNRR